MKITLNVFLAVVLFCSVAFAGDMGNGGRPGDDPTNTIPAGAPTPPPPPGDMGNGGRPGGNPLNNGPTDFEAAIIVLVRQYLGLGF